MKRCHRVEWSGCSPQRISHSPRTHCQVCERVRQAALLFIRKDRTIGVLSRSQLIVMHTPSDYSCTLGCSLNHPPTAKHAHQTKMTENGGGELERKPSHAHTVKRSSSKGNLAAVKHSGSTGEANNVCANPDQNASVKNPMSPGSDKIATPTEEVSCVIFSCPDFVSIDLSSNAICD